MFSNQPSSATIEKLPCCATSIFFFFFCWKARLVQHISECVKREAPALTWTAVNAVLRITIRCCLLNTSDNTISHISAVCADLHRLIVRLERLSASQV